MIDGNVLISRLKKMSEIKSFKNVPNMTNYLFPGSHCPMMGANLAIGGIENALMVTIGTDECTYYNKAFLGSSDKFGGMGGRCVSIVLTDHDITFGSIDSAKRAFAELFAEYTPDCVFLVTTCVIEIIGDDMDAFADELTEIYGVPVLPVHTEHFKCQDHLPGVERTMEACIDLMEKQAEQDGVNLIGERLGDLTRSEVYAVLKENDVKMGMILPGSCTVAQIKDGAKAKLNIVTHEIGLPLAKKMKQRFGVEYVEFFRIFDPEYAYSQYQEIFKMLGKDLPAVVTEKYTETQEIIKNLKSKADGVTYVYGNTPFENLPTNEYFCNLGMKPLLIQLSKLDKQDQICKEEILKLADPYVTSSANVVPFQKAVETLKPTLYFGVMRRSSTPSKVASVQVAEGSSMLGFELIQRLSNAITGAINGEKTMPMPMGGGRFR